MIQKIGRLVIELRKRGAILIGIAVLVAIGSLKLHQSGTSPFGTGLSSLFAKDVPGTEEFGLTKRQLVKSIEAVEALIADCMRENGFEYIPASYKTVRRGMNADKSLPGQSEKGFIARHGFGISTFYTGNAPQLNDGYSPARIGLGDQNIRIFENLSPADQVAYNHTLLGENTEVTFAVGLEIEDFSRCGGCTRKAIEQVFTPEQLRATYRNPKDAMIDRDPRMIEALKKIADGFRKAGYDYNHTDEVEPDIRRRLYEITGGGTVPLERLSPEARVALEKLQAYERAVAVLTHQLESKIYDPVEARIEREVYARKPQ